MAVNIMAAAAPGLYDNNIEFLDGDYEKVRRANPDEFVPLDKWDEVFISDKWWAQGLPLDDADMPSRAKITGPRHKVRDVYQLRNCLCVSEAFRALIEAQEPDAHQFFPLDLEWPNRDPIGRHYWFNPCHRLDALPEGRAPDGTRIFKPDHDVALDRSVVGGKAAFVLKRYTRNHNQFISDEVYRGYLAAGLTGAAFNTFAEA